MNQLHKDSKSHESTFPRALGRPRDTALAALEVETAERSGWPVSF